MADRQPKIPFISGNIREHRIKELIYLLHRATVRSAIKPNNMLTSVIGKLKRMLSEEHSTQVSEDRVATLDPDTLVFDITNMNGDIAMRLSPRDVSNMFAICQGVIRHTRPNGKLFPEFLVIGSTNDITSAETVFSNDSVGSSNSPSGSSR